jgi:hypothetical protein
MRDLAGEVTRRQAVHDEIAAAAARAQKAAAASAGELNDAVVAWRELCRVVTNDAGHDKRVDRTRAIDAARAVLGKVAT